MILEFGTIIVKWTAKIKKNCTPPGFLFVQPKQEIGRILAMHNARSFDNGRQKWKVSEAVFAWCTLCNCKVKWKLGEINFVKSAA